MPNARVAEDEFGKGTNRVSTEKKMTSQYRDHIDRRQTSRYREGVKGGLYPALDARGRGNLRMKSTANITCFSERDKWGQH